MRKGYATPHVTTLGGRKVLISQGAMATYGYDPRTGEQIYRLVNIDRSEPDSLLFTVPEDYEILKGRQFTLKSLAKPKITVKPKTN